MKEYEYSKKVKSLSKYIDYCKKNGFTLESKTMQTRTIYRKKDKTIARITINKSNNNITRILDFKEDKLSQEELIIRKESSSLEFTDEKAINSILDFLEYKKDNTLKRTRYTYKKDNIIFELDEYTQPEKCKVVSLEGEKNIVDTIWHSL